MYIIDGYWLPRSLRGICQWSNMQAKWLRPSRLWWGLIGFGLIFYCLVTVRLYKGTLSRRYIVTLMEGEYQKRLREIRRPLLNGTIDMVATVSNSSSNLVRSGERMESIKTIHEVASRINIKTIFPRYGIPMLKIRRSRYHFIFNMGIPIPIRRHLYIETGPRSFQWRKFLWQFSSDIRNKHLPTLVAVYTHDQKTWSISSILWSSIKICKSGLDTFLI